MGSTEHGLEVGERAGGPDHPGQRSSACRRFDVPFGTLVQPNGGGVDVRSGVWTVFLAR